MKQKIGIALSGGGARGIAHLGILKALEEFGIAKIKTVVAIKVGTIIRVRTDSGLLKYVTVK
jgi:NTE family protein